MTMRGCEIVITCILSRTTVLVVPTRSSCITTNIILWFCEPDFLKLWCKGTIHTLDTTFWTRRVGSKYDMMGILRENSQVVILFTMHHQIWSKPWSPQDETRHLGKFCLIQLDSDTWVRRNMNTRSSGYDLRLLFLYIS